MGFFRANDAAQMLIFQVFGAQFNPLGIHFGGLLYFARAAATLRSLRFSGPGGCFVLLLYDGSGVVSREENTWLSDDPFHKSGPEKTPVQNAEKRNCTAKTIQFPANHSAFLPHAAENHKRTIRSLYQQHRNPPRPPQQHILQMLHSIRYSHACRQEFIPCWRLPGWV